MDEIRNTLENDLILLERLVIELEERQRYLYYTYDPRRDGVTKYVDFHKDQRHFIYLKGAQRSGKSFLAYKDVIELCLDEQPWKKLKNMNSKGEFVENQPPYYCWIVVSTFKKVIEHYWREIMRILPMNRVVKVTYEEKSNKYYIYFDNGSMIIFKSQEENIGAFKSAPVHVILQDEREDNEERRLQLKTRIISNYGYYFTTMDTSDPDDYIEEVIESGYGALYEFNLKDNAKYLPKESIEMIEGMKESVDKERMFYGRFAERDIEYIFPQNLWTSKNYMLIEPKRYSYFDGQLAPDESGYIRIFKEPENGVKYYFGHDPASGNGTGNANAGQMFSEYGEQVATLFDNTVSYVNLPDMVLLPLLKKYNDAYYIPECKSDFATYIIEKVRERHGKIYTEVIIQPDKLAKHIILGIRTNEQNKYEMKTSTYADLLDAQGHPSKLILHDHMTKVQLEGYVADHRERDSQKKQPIYHGTKTPDMKQYKEMKNSTDDLVMALFFVDRAMNKLGVLKAKVERAKDYDELKLYYQSKRHSYYSA